MNRQNDESLAAVCALQYPRLLERARYFLGPRSGEAHDYVQDVLERFLLRFPDGPPPEPKCSIWLLTTLTNLLISGWRKHQVRQRAHSNPALSLMVAPEPCAPLDTEPEDVEPPADDVRTAVGRLNDKQRPVVELRALGLSHREIAARLCISSAAASKRYFDARRHLRAHFGVSPRTRRGRGGADPVAASV